MMVFLLKTTCMQVYTERLFISYKGIGTEEKSFPAQNNILPNLAIVLVFAQLHSFRKFI